MDSLDTNFLLRPIHGDFKEPMLGKRPVVLRDLISLWQIGIEVILAGPLGLDIDSAIETERCTHGKNNGHTVQDRKSTRKAQTHRAGVHVWRLAEFGRA